MLRLRLTAVTRPSPFPLTPTAKMGARVWGGSPSALKVTVHVQVRTRPLSVRMGVLLVPTSRVPPAPMRYANTFTNSKLTKLGLVAVMVTARLVGVLGTEQPMTMLQTSCGSAGLDTSQASRLPPPGLPASM